MHHAYELSSFGSCALVQGGSQLKVNDKEAEKKPVRDTKD